MPQDKAFAKFRFKALDAPVYWLFTALSFRDAARTILPTVAGKSGLDMAPDGLALVSPLHNATNVYVFLVTLSLENLLKAEYMRQHPGAVVDGKLPRVLTSNGHDLARLADLGCVQLTPEEQDVLHVASIAATSWGRYPGGVAHDRGDIAPPDDLEPRAFSEAYEALFGRLTDIVMQDMVDQ